MPRFVLFVRLIAAGLAGGMAGSGLAWGQEAITTAGGTGAAPTAAGGAQPLTLGAHQAFDDRGAPPLSPCAALGLGPGPDLDDPPPSPGAAIDHKVHGEVFGGVGTHGYREGGAALCAPIGDHAAVAVSVDAARIGR